MTRPSSPANETLTDLIDRCERYAKIIEGIIVVPDDWQPGGPERREPRETLLEAAQTLRTVINAQPTPSVFYLAQLRHAYTQLAAGTVKNQKEFADGLIAPAIRDLEQSAFTSPEYESQAKEPKADVTGGLRCGDGAQGSSRHVAGRTATTTSENMDVTARRDGTLIQPQMMRETLESARDYIASVNFYAAGTPAYIKNCEQLIKIDAVLAHTRPKCGDAT